MWWFYLHCVVAVVMVISDARGTLEPTLKEWEKKLGIPVPDEIEGVESGKEKTEGL
tara:strand:+ start:239 stop:406 length:168 start_codon:yes stop_codon:yes gene_type:complete